MGIREQLNADLKEALRERDDVRKRTIRSVIAAIKTEETNLDASGERITLDEQDIQAVIAKQAKQRRESISEYGRAGRDDLVAEEQAELGILKTYLPQQMSRDEIEVEVRKVIDEVGATGPQDMGKVMKPLMNR
ncbi:MAG: GatB/YqeY domain-containing protein, partial [Anaerolineae bacterium]